MKLDEISFSKTLDLNLLDRVLSEVKRNKDLRRLNNILRTEKNKGAHSTK